MRFLIFILTLILLSCCKSFNASSDIGKDYSTSPAKEDKVDLQSKTVRRTNSMYDELKSVRDSIDINDVLKKTFKDGRSARIVLKSKSYYVTDIMSQFAVASKNGNKEIEEWLLEFFEDYFEGVINWNNICAHCDGVGGKPDLFMSHLNWFRLKYVGIMPPSQAKIDLIMRLYNQEPDTYWEGGDHDPIINGNQIVLELLIDNIPYHLRPYRKYLGEYSEEAESEVDKIVLELYNQIKNGEIALIDRETWKSM
jgi:hypothetical protein